MVTTDTHAGAKILVVDDDPSLLKVVTMRLESEGYSTQAAGDSATALAMAKETPFDVALIDLKLGHENGIDLLEELKKRVPDLAGIILTAYGTIDSVVTAMQKGAQNYLTKPVAAKELLTQVETALSNRQVPQDLQSLAPLSDSGDAFALFQSSSRKIQQLVSVAAKVAQTEAPCLISGESGTGKEVLAQAIHVASERKEASFVALNCAAVPAGLFESELFGHQKGAFTGADRTRQGLMSKAGEGTFFLDEITEIPRSLQAKLLRVLAEKVFYPVGSSLQKPFTARLLAATNQDLKKAVTTGRLREDLFYRLNVFSLKVPPLRDHKMDIPRLAHYFLTQYAQKMERSVTGFSTAAMQKLMSYNWPGNIRELRNTVEVAVSLTEKDVIEDTVIALDDGIGEMVPQLKEARDQFEKDYLTRLMVTAGGNVSQAAKMAGRHRTDLYNLLKKFNIDPTAYRNEE